jgi:hypothetical protein
MDRTTQLTRHNAIARKGFALHTKLRTSMCLELIDFVKGAWIKQEFQAFSRGQATPGVDLVNAGLSAAHEGGLSFSDQAFAEGLFEEGRIRLGVKGRGGGGKGAARG